MVCYVTVGLSATGWHNLRDFCGALFFPTVATFLGATLYKNVPSQFKRTLLGGLTFAAIKGVLKIYHKQHAYIRQCQKQILDYTE